MSSKSVLNDLPLPWPRPANGRDNHWRLQRSESKITKQSLPKGQYPSEMKSSTNSTQQIAYPQKCSIDLKGNVLRIGTTGTETPFLAESELPEYARLSGNSVEEAVRQSIREMEDEALQKALENSAKERKSGAEGDGGPFRILVYIGGARDSETGNTRSNNNRQPSSSEVLPSDNFSEDDVKEIQNMGFSREQVLSELRQFNGDKTQAIAALFAKSLKF